MARKNADLHGNVPDSSPVALILIDVINDLEFDGGEQFARQAPEMADRIAGLKRRAKAVGIPVIYANDNFGRWQSDITKVLEHCLENDVRGRALAERLHPDDDDYIVLKPKHSGFYSTTLDTLLHYLGVETLVLAGIAGNSCILFTANDAYMRDYILFIPSDCVISRTEEANEHALDLMRELLKADTTPSTVLDLEALSRGETVGAED
jgi:nicotinamidase-related amidase